MAVSQRSKRFGVLGIVALVAFGLLGTRLWFLQTDEAESLQADIERERTKTVPLLPERGRIFDADGRIAADNQRILTVAVDWSVMRDSSDRSELFTRLSGWIEVPVEDMEERYHAIVYSPYLPMPVKEDVDQDVAVALSERSEDFPGVHIVEDWKRTYPYAPLASHVIGYMGAIGEDDLEKYVEKGGYVANEEVGRSGVEMSMEKQLHGQTGERVYEVNSAGEIVRLLDETLPVNGKDIQLSIDLDVQQYAEELLQTQLQRIRAFPTDAQARNPVDEETGMRMDPNYGDRKPYPAPAGSIVTMNYETGQVAAMASYPTFDNRWFTTDLPDGKFSEIFPPEDAYESQAEAADNATLTNRALQGQYNMGSTFKPFSAYAGINSGVIGPYDYYEDTGTYRMASIEDAVCADGVRCEFRNALCSHTGEPCVYGSVSVYEALAVSSDAFFYRIGELATLSPRDEKAFERSVGEFGFGQTTGIDLPYEFSGRVPSDQLKNDLIKSGALGEGESDQLLPVDNLQAAIGQGLLAATPLQLAVGYSAIGNGGDVVTPHVVRAIYEPGVPDGAPGFADLSRGEVVRTFIKPDVQQKVGMDEATLNQIRAGLRRNITGPGFNGRSTTSEELFATGYYPSEAIPVAGKTGTAQGFNNYPWNDSSVFAAYSVEPENGPYTVTSYLEKGGYGARGSGPVIKCMFTALSGLIETNPVVQSDPLDPESNEVAEPAVGNGKSLAGGTECLAAANFNPEGTVISTGGEPLD